MTLSKKVYRAMTETWIRVDENFPDRRAVVVVPMRYAPETDEICVAIRRGLDAGDPSSVEVEIGRLISAMRPDLTGCCLHFINCNWPRMTYEIGISHPSLEAAIPGSFCKQIELPRERI